MEGEVNRTKAITRRMPVGAEAQEEGVHFRVWAPDSEAVAVVLENETPEEHLLAPEGNGYFSSLVRSASAGTLYRYRLGDGNLYPDPASRFQPLGPHGPSEVISPAFNWTDAAWRGIPPDEHILYELHIGTFTLEGTWKAAEKQLPELKRLGITTIEVMPVADFPGDFGWGYDGVNLFAPMRKYGRPEDVRHFVDAAHREGLAVILDVVYNHFGPDGNYLPKFTPRYFGTQSTEWGDAPNFDGPHNGPVREFFCTNAAYWIDEYHFDGLRLDATQQIFDTSTPNIIADIADAARHAGGSRSIYVIAENEAQHAKLMRPKSLGGYGLNGMYNDDFHHAAIVGVTGRAEAYYSDYNGSPQEFVSLARKGYLYQGQYSWWQHQRRGRPALDISPRHFIIGIENHDQIANSSFGIRAHLLTSPGRYRAIVAVMMLFPQTPMLFQGQEFAASAGFFYFADHKGELARNVREARKKFLSQFPSIATQEMLEKLSDPDDPQTFMKAKLDFSERDRNRQTYDLHRDLIHLRKEDPVFSHPVDVDGAVLGPEAFVIRYFGPEGEDRLLLVNLGRDLHIFPVPFPLLAPPEDKAWTPLWSSEHPAYGGGGTPPASDTHGWHLPGHSALVMGVAPA